jgi:hypothetical protein
MFPKDINNLHVLVKDCLIGETPAMDNTEGNNLIIKHKTEVFPMKLKDAARIACLLDTEGSIRVATQIHSEYPSLYPSLRICLSIANTDLGILNWAKRVLEEELHHSIPIYHSSGNQERTKECYQLQLFRLEDVHKILNIVRKHMLSVKKKVADLIVSFFSYRMSLLNEQGNLKKEHSYKYEKAYDELIKKVEKIKQTYDQIRPVTTVHSPDLNGQKIQSGLVSDDERLAEMTSPLEKA